MHLKYLQIIIAQVEIGRTYFSINSGGCFKVPILAENRGLAIIEPRLGAYRCREKQWKWGRGQMGFYISIIIIILCILLSLRELFIPGKIKGKKMSIENFFILAIIYATVMIGFGLIYYLVGAQGHPVLIEADHNQSETTLGRVETSLYFSAITLFSVGYGDIAPIGIGRIIAVLQALIGYTIPAAFVARTVFDRRI
jgi:potassium channel LctB